MKTTWTENRRLVWLLFSLCLGTLGAIAMVMEARAGSIQLRGVGAMDLVYNPVVDNYFVVWERTDAVDKGIYGARLNWDASIIETQIAIQADLAHYPAIAVGSQGSYITAWQYENNSYDYVKAQRLNYDGTLYGDSYVCGGNSQVPDVASTGNSGDWLLALDTAIEWRYVNSYHLNWAYPYQMDNEENYISLYELNVDRTDSSTGRTIGPDGIEDRGIIYPWIVKDGSRLNFRTSTSEAFANLLPGDVITGSLYPYTASISKEFYSATDARFVAAVISQTGTGPEITSNGSISNLRALKNTINYINVFPSVIIQ